jgi:hypothetical protein
MNNSEPLKRSEIDQVDALLRPYLLQNLEITKNYLAGLGFLRMNAGRDPEFSDQHLLTYVGHDFIESALSIHMLTVEGMQRVVRRELRFVVEASIKMCFIHQKEYRLPIKDKLLHFEHVLKSSNISIKKDINLMMLSEATRTSFSEELGRFYGDASNYVHLTTKQLAQRMEKLQAGETPGREKPEDVKNINDLVRRGYALSLVLLYHSTPSCVVGDWLVESDGGSNPWYFRRSKYIAEMDAYFDYKAERQNLLEELKSQRERGVEF